MSAADLFESVTTTLSQDTAITRSKMFGSPGLKIGGKVFAVLVKGKLVVKLPRGRVDALVGSAAGERFDPGMGRLTKEWVTVEAGTEAQWLDLAKEARDFVASGL